MNGIRGFGLLNPLMKMDHFVRHDLSKRVEMTNVPSTDRDNVFIRSYVSRVVTLLFCVVSNPELVNL